jgi:hypothetical protein
VEGRMASGFVDASVRVFLSLTTIPEIDSHHHGRCVLFFSERKEDGPIPNLL